ncbi:hypothetical protein FGO68_gene12114 [Halteria grandinella]|uniref:Tim10-like domain-containing protein n=1 Tax=Halteria grandinella TaxID=5974 RepID=A0A8J8NIK6_HALGN|nr:hypothetical protein FGO68_gene12114 [Halteria grandinella]
MLRSNSRSSLPTTRSTPRPSLAPRTASASFPRLRIRELSQSSRLYPMNSYDQYRMKSDTVGYLAEVLQENCFDLCINKSADLPFLSVGEGLCFRNCITKFSVFYPTLQANLASADFRHYEQQLISEGAKKDQRIKAATTDPWEKESSKLFASLGQKPQAI